MLLAGVPGVDPAQVAVLGGGVAGQRRPRRPRACGAEVTVLDTNSSACASWTPQFDGRVQTIASNGFEIERSGARRPTS